MEPRRWEEIEAAFRELVTLDGAARRERLVALGATDPALRAAVEKLLAADAEAERRLGPIAASLVGNEPFGRLTAALAGRYRVERELGHGGMATVYLAHDLKHYRPVALKVLRPELAAALGRERFLREVALTARLDHPHIVPLLDSGEAGGLVYYVMPYVAGESLRDRLDREKQLSVEAALQITREVADALDYAHGHGIIHRDIKPANILLGDGHARVADFGIARAVTAAGGAALTETGLAVGTPAYMSPEQASAEHLIDGRSDVYSLASVVYEMLAGQPPYTGATPAAILSRKLAEPVPGLRVARAAVPAGMEQALTQGLAKVPADRFATASQFADALQRGVHEQRPPPSRRIAQRVLVAGVAVALLAVAAVFAIRNSSRRAESLSRVVVMPFDNRTGDASLDPVGAITADWVTQGLTEPGFLVVLDTRQALDASRTLGAGASPKAVGRETGADVVVEGSYFLQDDSLQFQARIVSTGNGSILTSIGSIKAARARPQAGAEQMRQHVLAALASLHDKSVANFQTSLSQPPTYDAYREYAEGLALYMRYEYGEALGHFQRAALLDSSFLTARVWAAQTALWTQPEIVTRLATELRPLRDRLTPFDRARLDFIVAIHQAWGPDSGYAAADLEGAYRAALQMVDAAPGSVDAQREAGISALRVLRPHEALIRLRELEPDRGLMREWSGYWSAVTFAYHMLGQHEDELAAARRCRVLFPTSWDHGPREELRALAALGRVGELDSLVHAYFLIAGWSWSGDVAYSLAGELLAHGHAEAARHLARWEFEQLRVHPPPNSAGNDEQDQRLELQAELALFLGDAETAADLVARFHDPEAHDWLRARILAVRGKHDAARATLEQARRRAPPTRLSRHGLAIARASVLVALGELDSALTVLQHERWLWPTLGTRVGGLFLVDWNRNEEDGHATLALAPLGSDPRFRALIKPRG